MIIMKDQFVQQFVATYLASIAANWKTDSYSFMSQDMAHRLPVKEAFELAEAAFERVNTVNK